MTPKPLSITPQICAIWLKRGCESEKNIYYYGSGSFPLEVVSWVCQLIKAVTEKETPVRVTKQHHTRVVIVFKTSNEQYLKKKP